MTMRTKSKTGLVVGQWRLVDRRIFYYFLAQELAGCGSWGRDELSAASEPPEAHEPGRWASTKQTRRSPSSAGAP